MMRALLLLKLSSVRSSHFCLRTNNEPNLGGTTPGTVGTEGTVAAGTAPGIVEEDQSISII